MVHYNLKLIPHLSINSGIKPVDKKDGAGSHNWGTHNDEIE